MIQKLTIFLCCISCLYSQDVKLNGRFLTDRMELGEKVSYVLRVEFPAEEQVLMPDSTGDFQGFTLLNIKTHHSRLSGDYQVDSVIYELVSFQTDSIQYLSLPIYKFMGEDSSKHYPLRDSIQLVKTQVAEDLVSDIQPVPMSYSFNYQLLGIAILVFIFVGYFSYRAYSKRMKLFWKKITQRRRFKKYIQLHNQLLKTFQQTNDVEVLEKIIGNWKEIMSEISLKPINTYTAREVNTLYNDKKMYEALQNIDKAIYSGVFNKQLSVDIEIIYNKSKTEFFKHIKTSKNG